MDAAPIDLAALEELLVRFSQLVIEQRWIKETRHQSACSFRPNTSSRSMRASLLHDPQTREADLPRSPIRPYPTEYIDDAKNRRRQSDHSPNPAGGRAANGRISQNAFRSQRVSALFWHLVSLEKRIMHERLRRVCFIDYDREIALVVDLENRDGTHQILGVGRLIKEHETNEAEFAVLISDPWQGKGLGSELLKLLVQIGRKERLRRITGRISPENTTMKTVSEQVGFSLRFDKAEGEWKAEINL